MSACTFTSALSGIRCQMTGQHYWHWARDTEGRVVLKVWNTSPNTESPVPTGEEQR